ncbi:MAG: glycerol-3-phosphate 1-O-acyltransferase PlsY [Clostridia bacterium]|nr:glycerol-3-phosphate 1-O-acyltransferase PlsY [Clostridia bacterium]
MDTLIFILVIIAIGFASYLIGSINCSILISKIFKQDVRNSGSGNAGATNMLRTFGPAAGVITMLGDFLKTLIPLVATRIIFKDEEYWQAMVAFSGFCCSMGHAFPIYFGFRGGKAVTVVAMVLFVVDWRCFVVAVSLFVLTIALTRYVSLGSMIGAFSGPVTMFFISHDNLANRWFVVVCLLALAIMILLLHWENVKRLVKGTERKFKFKKD